MGVAEKNIYPGNVLLVLMRYLAAQGTVALLFGCVTCVHPIELAILRSYSQCPAMEVANLFDSAVYPAGAVIAQQTISATSAL